VPKHRSCRSEIGSRRGHDGTWARSRSGRWCAAGVSTPHRPPTPPSRRIVAIISSSARTLRPLAEAICVGKEGLGDSRYGIRWPDRDGAGPAMRVALAPQARVGATVRRANLENEPTRRPSFGVHVHTSRRVTGVAALSGAPWSHPEHPATADYQRAPLVLRDRFRVSAADWARRRAPRRGRRRWPDPGSYPHPAG
jgi:hypothetical protein